MPFCTACGNSVKRTAAFCQACGSKQPGVEPGPETRRGEEWLEQISPVTASTLCYVPFAGWLASLVFLSAHRFRQDRQVRFHAFQGLYLFVLWMLIDSAIAPFVGFSTGTARRVISGTLHLSIVAAWLLMVYRTYMGELVRLPFLGELAERSVAEQRS